MNKTTDKTAELIRAIEELTKRIQALEEKLTPPPVPYYFPWWLYPPPAPPLITWVTCASHDPIPPDVTWAVSTSTKEK